MKKIYILCQTTSKSAIMSIIKVSINFDLSENSYMILGGDVN